MGADHEILMPDCPSYAWAVRSEAYLNYLWRSADKFAAGFEIVRARCQVDLVTWEQTKMMAMFLRCLRFVFGSHQLCRESALWWSRRERPVGDPPAMRVWYGLGFANTLPRYGYCWIEPRVDWERLEFRTAVTDHVLFGNDRLRRQYLRRGGQVRAFFAASHRLDLAKRWHDGHHRVRAIRNRMIFWMVHVCLQQFREDVMATVKAEIDPALVDDAVRGERPFCYEYFEEIMRDDVHLVSGNRSDYKHPSQLGQFLFGFDDGRVRAHWEDRPFRTLYCRTYRALALGPGGLDTAESFARRLSRCLHAHHWILPYPSNEVFTQTTKQGQRMWYSIRAPRRWDGGVVDREDLQDLEPREWEWARKSWRQGEPAPLPGYMVWSKEEWEGWIDRHSS